MLTVKIKKGSSTTIVEAQEVNIKPFGKDPQIIAPNAGGPVDTVRIVICKTGSYRKVFYVATEPLTQDNSFIDFEGGESPEAAERFYDCAYVENDRCTTTEKVFPVQPSVRQLNNHVPIMTLQECADAEKAQRS